MAQLKVTQHPSNKHSELVTGVSWSSTNELLTVADDKQVLSKSERLAVANECPAACWCVCALGISAKLSIQKTGVMLLLLAPSCGRVRIAAHLWSAAQDLICRHHVISGSWTSCHAAFSRILLA